MTSNSMTHPFQLEIVCGVNRLLRRHSKSRGGKYSTYRADENASAGTRRRGARGRERQQGFREFYREKNGRQGLLAVYGQTRKKLAPTHHNTGKI